MRVFVAVGLPEATGEALAAVHDALDAGRAVAPENMHLTLAFLGERSAGEVQEVSAALAGISLPAFEMRIRGLEVYGGRRPKLLAAGVEGSAALSALRDKVRGAARRAGVALQRERFRPHVTLVRFSRDMPRHKLDRVGELMEARGAFSLAAVRVEGFALYRSRLRHDGARYEALAEFRLG